MGNEYDTNENRSRKEENQYVLQWLEQSENWKSILDGSERLSDAVLGADPAAVYSSAPLYEKYRPRSWEDVVGQDKALKKISILKRRGLGGRAYWISGQSGTGKTTIARLLAREVADNFYIEEIDASKLTPVKLEETIGNFHYSAFGQGGHALIANEAHGLRKDTIRQLLVYLEPLPKQAMIVFTTTCEAQADFFEEQIDANPLLSRCIHIELARRDIAKPFAERAKYIAEREGLDNQELPAYIRLAQQCRNNLRMMLSKIEAGEMIG